MSETIRRLYLLHGMKRSGNHAFVNWLLPQLRASFFNNLVPVGPILRGQSFPSRKPFAAWRAQQDQLIGGSLSHLLVSLEDHDLRMAPFLDVDIPECRLLLLRSPDQLFASRLRKAFRTSMPAYPRDNGVVMQRAIGLWKQHARAYLGQGRDYPGRVAVLFDQWFDDAGYRKAISEALAVEFDDSGFGMVSADGGGSSFDGTRFDGRGHLMEVNDRVAALEPHERELLDAIMSDPELRDISSDVRDADPYRQIVAG